MDLSHEDTAALESLAARLDDRTYVVSLVKGDGRRPRLHITNRQAVPLAESVYADSESYWWGWCERIAPVTDQAAAAAAIDGVLQIISPNGPPAS